MSHGAITKIRSNLILGFVGILGGILWICTSTAVVHAEHRLRVGTLQIAPETKWVVLGVQVHPHFPIKGLNFSSIGFQGKDLQEIDPKFLLEVTSDGITQVRSFELSAYQPFDLLPPVLITVADAKKDEFLHSFGNVAAVASKSLWIAGLPTTIGQIWTKNAENIRKLQAYYLLELIDKALPIPGDGIFPELLEALTPSGGSIDQAKGYLEALGGALLSRYNPRSNFVGMIETKHPAQSYVRWRGTIKSKRSENSSYLLNRTNELGTLRTTLFDEDLALVSVELSRDEVPASLDKYQPIFMGLGSANRGPAEILEEVQSRKTVMWDEGHKIPWYVLSFVNPDGPNDLGNFVFPEEFGQKLKKLSQSQLARDIAGTLTPLYWPIKWVNDFYQVAQLEKENTTFLKRLQSYGALLALTETHAHTPLHSPGINQEFMKDSLRKFQIELRPGHSVTQASFLNEAISLLIAEEEKRGRLLPAPTRNDSFKTKKALRSRLERFIRKRLPSLEIFSEKLELSGVETHSSISRANRKPSGGPSSGVEENAIATALPVAMPMTQPELKPVILFFVDGLRPDRFRLAAKQGLMPHLKELFLDRGTQAHSFASRSLTFPSWSTILTGFEPDMHGIRSNTVTSRTKHTVTENYQDARPDLLGVKNRVKTRAFQRLEEDQVGEIGKVWFPAYFEKSQSIYSFMPAVSGANSAAEGVIEDFISRPDQYFSGIRYLASALDRGSSLNTTRLIEAATRDKKPIKLVMNWYASVDEASHYVNQFLPTIYREVDENVNRVLTAARAHPDLKDATVFLISDHGHNGGYGPFDETSTIYQNGTKTGLEYQTVTDGPLLKHTGLNLTQLFTGKLSNYPQYDFVVGAADSPAPKFELRVLEEFMIQPFHYVYPKGRGAPTALVDCSGDNTAQIYIKGDPHWNRLNFHQLSNFRHTSMSKGKDVMINFPGDLLNLRLKDLMVTDEGLHKRIKELSHHHPVELFAMPLKDSEAIESIRTLFAQDRSNLGSNANQSSDAKPDYLEREPVLVVALGPEGSYLTSVIQTRSDHSGHDEFKYTVMRNFSQDNSGRITATISMNSSDDPLHYLDQVDGAQDYWKWRTDREWLELAKDHVKPTAIFALPRYVTLAPKFTDPASTLLSNEIKNARQGEIPDFILLSHPGFAFHSDTPQQSDHGGLTREEVLDTFFVGSLDATQFTHPSKMMKPVLTRDFMPTILDFAGFNPARLSVQGQSFRSDLLEAGAR